MFEKVKTSLDIIWVSHFMRQVIDMSDELESTDEGEKLDWAYGGCDVSDHMDASANVLSELVAHVASERQARMEFASAEWQAWLW
jgi:hypothetical protein